MGIKGPAHPSASQPLSPFCHLLLASLRHPLVSLRALSLRGSRDAERRRPTAELPSSQSGRRNGRRGGPDVEDFSSPRHLHVSSSSSPLPPPHRELQVINLSVPFVAPQRPFFCRFLLQACSFMSPCVSPVPVPVPADAAAEICPSAPPVTPRCYSLEEAV